MRIAVCDDSKTEREQVLSALREYDPTRKPESFASGSDLLAAAVNEPHFDIVFLDIYMPGENGVDIAKELQKLSPTTGIVFVTTSMYHAIDAFSLGAVHYLVKPVTTEGVMEALQRLAALRMKERPVIVLSTGGNSRNVYLDEIRYIQSVGHAKELNMTDGKVIRVWMPMEELMPKLGDTFLKLNRSFIVNMEQIEQMGTDSCLLRDGTELDFARRERVAIRTAYDNYLFNRLSDHTNGGVVGHELFHQACSRILYPVRSRHTSLPAALWRRITPLFPETYYYFGYSFCSYIFFVFSCFYRE